MKRMVMIFACIALLLYLIVRSSFIYAQEQGASISPEKTTSSIELAAIEQQEQQREQHSLQQLTQVEQQLNQINAKLAAAEVLSQQLVEQFAHNEEQLVTLNQQWDQASSSINDLFSVSRQGAKEAIKLLSSSALQAQYPDRLAVLTSMQNDQTIPDRHTLAQLPTILLQEIKGSGEIVQLNRPLLDAQGIESSQNLTRVGGFMLFNSDNFYQIGEHLDSNRRSAISPILGVPTSLIRSLTSYQGEEGDSLPLDIAHGSLLQIQTQLPSVWQKITQGGKVGAIIIVVATVGMIIALVRLFVLTKELRQVRQQLKETDNHSDNALGRVLAISEQYPNLTLERLELRLDEAILKETPRLERGISMVKMIAAIAPMMGLLGTVTGMISTFQAITLFGTGDPKIMAGGISMALVTTVLGLVAAIPLILAHSLLQSRFIEISNILELQVAGILAERAEAME